MPLSEEAILHVLFLILPDAASDPIVISPFSNIAFYLKYLRVYEATDKYHTA